MTKARRSRRVMQFLAEIVENPTNLGIPFKRPRLAYDPVLNRFFINFLDYAHTGRFEDGVSISGRSNYIPAEYALYAKVDSIDGYNQITSLSIIEYIKSMQTYYNSHPLPFFEYDLLDFSSIQEANKLGLIPVPFAPEIKVRDQKQVGLWKSYLDSFFERNWNTSNILYIIYQNSRLSEPQTKTSIEKLVTFFRNPDSISYERNQHFLSKSLLDRKAIQFFSVLLSHKDAFHKEHITNILDRLNAHFIASLAISSLEGKTQKHTDEDIDFITNEALKLIIEHSDFSTLTNYLNEILSKLTGNRLCIKLLENNHFVISDTTYFTELLEERSNPEPEYQAVGETYDVATNLLDLHPSQSESLKRFTNFVNKITEQLILAQTIYENSEKANNKDSVDTTKVANASNAANSVDALREGMSHFLGAINGSRVPNTSNPDYENAPNASRETQSSRVPIIPNTDPIKIDSLSNTAKKSITV